MCLRRSVSYDVWRGVTANPPEEAEFPAACFEDQQQAQLQEFQVSHKGEALGLVQNEERCPQELSHQLTSTLQE
jgi:hypothetical protein